MTDTPAMRELEIPRIADLRSWSDLLNIDLGILQDACNRGEVEFLSLSRRRMIKEIAMLRWMANLIEERYRLRRILRWVIR